MVVRQDILGGLKVALAKGKPLQETMQAFYNAGYKKEEIEEAARELYAQRTSPSQIPQQNFPPAQKMQPPYQNLQQNSQEKKGFFEFLKKKKEQSLQNNPMFSRPIPINKPNNFNQNLHSFSQPMQARPMIKSPQIKQLPQPVKPAPRQIVSAYTQPKDKSGFDPITIILVVILLVLLGVLAAIFFYKDQLVNFLNQYLE